MKAIVYYNSVAAGLLERLPGKFRFQYLPEYVAISELPSISLTLPKRLEAYESPVLFPFFYGLLAEGTNKAIQCRELKIDENDHFTRLLKTMHEDSIGAVTVKPLGL